MERGIILCTKDVDIDRQTLFIFFVYLFDIYRGDLLTVSEGNSPNLF